MHPKRQKRLILIVSILFVSALAIMLALYALRQNINLYYTPTQVSQHQVPKGHVFRIGGLVEEGSIHHAAKGLEMSFVLTDTVHNIKVEYDGVLPDLFSEGQGIVAQGKLGSHGVFIADQVLAKHGANYMPPAVKQALEQAKRHKLTTATEHNNL